MIKTLLLGEAAIACRKKSRLALIQTEALSWTTKLCGSVEKRQIDRKPNQTDDRDKKMLILVAKLNRRKTSQDITTT